MRKRFGVCHVQSRPESSLLERRQQCRGINHRATRGVHKDRTGFHARQKFSIDHMLRLWRERKKQDHGVRLGQPVRQGFHRLSIRPLVTGNSDHANAERRKPGGDCPPNRTVAKNHHGSPPRTCRWVQWTRGPWP